MRIFQGAVAVLVPLLLLACNTDPQTHRRTLPLPEFMQPTNLELPPPVIRQPVLPEMLVPCRGHVLVPALGMMFVPRNGTPPDKGQFLREERLEPPYRILSPGARIGQDMYPARLNVELDKEHRIIGLYCG